MREWEKNNPSCRYEPLRLCECSPQLLLGVASEEYLAAAIIGYVYCYVLWLTRLWNSVCAYCSPNSIYKVL